MLPRRALASDGHTCAHGLERAVVRAVVRAVARAVARAIARAVAAPSPGCRPAVRPDRAAPTVDSPYVRVVVHPGSAVVALTPVLRELLDGLVEPDGPGHRAPPEGWGEASVPARPQHPRLVALARARAGRAARRRLEGEVGERGARLERRRGRSTPVQAARQLHDRAAQDELHAFANATGTPIVFGLSYPEQIDPAGNQPIRARGAASAAALMRYSAARGYDARTTLYGFELGEELTEYVEFTAAFDRYTEAYHGIRAQDGLRRARRRAAAAASAAAASARCRD